MAARELSAMATSALCSNMAMLLSAGIQVEEALSLLDRTCRRLTPSEAKVAAK